MSLVAVVGRWRSGRLFGARARALRANRATTSGQTLDGPKRCRAEPFHIGKLNQLGAPSACPGAPRASGCAAGRKQLRRPNGGPSFLVFMWMHTAKVGTGVWQPTDKPAGARSFIIRAPGPDFQLIDIFCGLAVAPIHLDRCKLRAPLFAIWARVRSGLI